MVKNLYSDYKFKVEEIFLNETLKAYHNIKVICKKIDNDIILSSINGGGDYTLYLQDRFFNFTINNETKRIGAFDGDLSFSKILSANIKLPHYIKDVILALNTIDDLPAGCGGYINFNNKKILYDESQKILQIGDIDNSEISYNFLSNAFTQIKKEKITGLIFTGIEI